MSKPFYIPLPNRGLIHIEGEDRIAFLQGLISQDVEKLESSKILYGCLLTPQGRFLHDFFLHNGNGFILIDCEGGTRAEDLYDRLNKYRLRSKVKLSVEPFHPVYALFNSDEGLPDPRHFKMGNRSFEKPQDMEVEPFEEWDMQRIILGIPDGSRDMKIERSTLLECNIDKVNGVDFDKGCYIGQELTARMHHRNLGKKHLRAVKFEGSVPPAPFSDIEIGDKIIGNMRSSCQNIGLAIIKDEYLESINNDANKFCILG
jgi:folate-binding protein YgfZ